MVSIEITNVESVETKQYGEVEVMEVIKEEMTLTKSVSSPAKENFSPCQSKASTPTSLKSISSPPIKRRPVTTDAVARRMIGRDLGLKIPEKTDAKTIAVNEALRGRRLDAETPSITALRLIKEQEVLLGLLMEESREETQEMIEVQVNIVGAIKKKLAGY